MPVLTGIGHEVDRSIADLVAHTSLKTPTACAAASSPSSPGARLTRRAEPICDSHRGGARTALDRSEQKVDHTAAAVQRDVNRALDVASFGAKASATRAAGRRRSIFRPRISESNAASPAWSVDCPRTIGAAVRHLDGVEARVVALDPARALAAGYSITRDRERGCGARRE